MRRITIAVLIILPGILATACQSNVETSPDVADVVSGDVTTTDVISGDLTPADLISDDLTPADVAPDGVQTDAIVTPDTLLPFHIERTPEGENLTAEEIAQTTDSVLALWRETQYFQWILDTSHGMAKGNEWGYPDYKLWWQDTLAVKTGDVVTFKHVGNGDNNLLRHSRVLLYALAGHLATGDQKLKEIAIQYMRGIQAMFTSMVWEGEDPPIDTIMARAIFNHNHSYLVSGDHQANIDYDPIKIPEITRRHDMINNPANPTFGDIWMNTKRSKDDLPFLYRDVPIMMRVIEKGSDPEVVAETEKTLQYIRRFCRDIVDHEYRIRTKDPEGVPYEPFFDGVPDEFACYTAYDGLGPNSECNAKLATALIAYQDPRGNDCLDGDTGVYEEFAVITAYWNTPIIVYFHIAALAQSLIEGENAMAEALARGLLRRVDKYMNSPETRATVGSWDGDATTFMITAASYGFPLTAREARFLSQQLQRASNHYRQFTRWNLWDESVGDGEFEFLPGDRVAGEIVDGQISTFQTAEIAALLEYCESPYKDPQSAPFVDCKSLLNTEKW